MQNTRTTTPSATSPSTSATDPALGCPDHAGAPRARRPRRRGATALAAFVALLALGATTAACGDDSDSGTGAGAAGGIEPTQLDDDGDATDHAHDDTSDGADDAGGLAAGKPPAGVPEECSIYPFAMEPADPDEITLSPDGWPAPPAGATLCVTSTAIGSSTEVAEYALGAEPETILGYYEAQLDGRFELAREAGFGAGEILTGYDDTVGFQIAPRDGGFKIAFSEL